MEKPTSPVESKPPRYRSIASCFSKASANVASLLRPTIYCLNVPILLAFFNSSANPAIKQTITLIYDKINNNNNLQPMNIMYKQLSTTEHN